MTEAADAEGWHPVDRLTRGRALKQRMIEHKMNPSRLAKEFGVSRTNVYAIFNGTAGEIAYDQMEAWFARLDAKVGADVPAELAPGEVSEPVQHDHVTIRLTGNFGVDATVEGPVEDIDALKQAAKELLREMQQDAKSD
jgi:DNA-binding Xre family transcriptional regulator